MNKEKLRPILYFLVLSALKIKKFILSKSVKTILLVFVVFLIFYFLFPKYYFIKEDNFLMRCNKLTGQCEKYSNHKWQMLK